MANSYLSRTPSSASNRKTWTWSGWVKRSSLSGSDYPRLFCASTSSTDRVEFYFQNTDELKSEIRIGNTARIVQTTRKFRDLSAWYHIVLAVDTTLSNSADRVKLYINGERVTDILGGETMPNQNDDTAVNNNVEHRIGNSVIYNTRYHNGYMSHVSFVDGQALAPTVFGQTDSTSGIWKFKSPSGVTWGTNGFHLKFENSAALGTDSSGNTNTFTVNGNLKQALDTPSNNYATFNPLWGTTSKTWTNANTSYSYADNYQRSSLFTLFSQYKFYLEWKVDNATAVYHLNLATEEIANDGRFGLDNSNNASYRLNDNDKALTFVMSGNTDGVVNINGSAVSATDLIRISTSDIGMMAFDPATGKLWLGKNGTWDKSGDPAGGNNPIYTWSSGQYTVGNPIYGGFGVEGGRRVDVNFGNGYFGTTAITSAGSNGNGSLFEYDVPSGFYALNTKNTNTYG